MTVDGSRADYWDELGRAHLATGNAPQAAMSFEGHRQAPYQVMYQLDQPFVVDVHYVLTLAAAANGDEATTTPRQSGSSSCAASGTP